MKREKLSVKNNVTTYLCTLSLTECSSNCDVNSVSSSTSTASSLSLAASNGEIPSLRDLSAEVARQQDVKKVLIVDARSYAAAVGNRQEEKEPLLHQNALMNWAKIDTV